MQSVAGRQDAAHGCAMDMGGQEGRWQSGIGLHERTHWIGQGQDAWLSPNTQDASGERRDADKDVMIAR